MLPNFFLAASTYVGTMPFHFRNISPWKIFHRHRQRHRHRCPTGILNIDWNWEKYFFKIFPNFFSSFFKTYMKAYILWVILMIFKIFFFHFFHFLRIFEKKYPIFLKSMTKIAPFPQANWSKKLQFLQFSRKTDHMSHPGKLQKLSFFAPVGLWKRCYLNFPKTCFLTNWNFH